MAAKFGRTWWGERWLDALSNIDHKNRLPRGRTYYNTGRIIELEWNSSLHRFEALVDGSAYHPYSVVLSIPQIPQGKAEELTASISRDPEAVSMLLDGTIPESIEEKAGELGIELFPRKWSDLGMKCSCPDSAVPCKHLAAVVYAVSKLIDKDPFLLFKVKGIDLKRALVESGAAPTDSTRIKPLSLDELLGSLPAQEAAPSKEKSRRLLRSAPYSEIPNLSQHILSLLAAVHPLSEEKNFSSWVKSMLKTASIGIERECRRQLLDEELARFLAESGFERSDFHAYRLNFDGMKAVVHEYVNGIESDRGGGLELLFNLMRIPNSDADSVPFELEVLRQICLFSKELLKRGALIPSMIESESGSLRIWWVPALRSPEVSSCFKQIALGASGTISSLCTLDSSIEYKNNKFALTYLCVSHICNTFINYYWEYTQTEPASLPQVLFSGSFNADYFDKLIDEEASSLLIRYMKPFLMADSYPWKPVVSARPSRSREHPGVYIDFGITPHAFKVQPGRKTEAHIPLGKILTDSAYCAERSAALSIVRTLAEVFPPLSALCSTGRPVLLDSEELKDFLFSAAPHLMLLGISVKMPQKLKKIIRPKLLVRAELGKGRSLIGRDAIADFKWRFTIGGVEYSLEDVKRIYGDLHASRVVQTDNEFVYLDPSELSRMISTAEAPSMSPMQQLRAVLAGRLPDAEVSASDELKSRIAELTESEEIPPPEGLQAQLRPYQARGYSWLVKNLDLGIGSLIADDMGLGKTIQVIASMLHLKNKGELSRKKIMVVVPASLIANWKREIARFAPGLTSCVYHGAYRSIPDASMFDVLITSYGTFARDCGKLASIPFRLLVVDEAQAVKNPETKQTRAIRGFPADQVVAMSGTPVENRLMELWSIFSCVQPGILGTASEFSEAFAEPIESEHDPIAAEDLKKLTAPFMIRRMKTDKAIISDLPEKNVMDVLISMTKQQAVLYGQALNRELEEIKKAEAEEPKGGAKKSAAVLSLISSLKQICNSPSQFLKTDSSSPDSGKAVRLLELLEELRANKRRTLVFTQYRETGERLQNWIESRFGFRPDFLNGSTTVAARQKMVDSFQSSQGAACMIISLKAGGTGLNLTAASAVIHYDLWWNPAVESQATDRAYRIGQKNNVLVYRFVTEGTFEEKINKMLEDKRSLAESTIASGESWICRMTSDEISRLFRFADGSEKTSGGAGILIDEEGDDEDPFGFESTPRTRGVE